MLRIVRKNWHFVLFINGEPSFILSKSELVLILRRIAAKRPGSPVEIAFDHLDPDDANRGCATSNRHQIADLLAAACTPEEG
jgi:hypothetical protein